MRVLFIDTQISGHHGTYLSGLLQALDPEDEYRVVLPEPMAFYAIPKTSCCYIPFEIQGKRRYRTWLNQVIRVADQYKPDCIHFVYGDDLYRFLGIGLHKLRNIAPLTVTFHQIRRSRLRDFSIKRISKRCRHVIVHTRQLESDLRAICITNVHHIEYPRFTDTQVIAKASALEQLGISLSRGKILLAMGGTRKDKGLDILLEALKSVKDPFHLIIAGKEEWFNCSFIQEKTKDYREKVSLFLEFLSDEKIQLCLNACDILVLPYRKSFDGASGPLGEGVWLKKEIIGPSHGSLKEMIENHHLGMVFETENPGSLTNVISKSLCEEWIPDDVYEAYRDELDPQKFAEKYRELYHGEDQ